jgi:hypothetical protein
MPEYASGSVKRNAVGSQQLLDRQPHQRQRTACEPVHLAAERFECMHLWFAFVLLC